MHILPNELPEAINRVFDVLELIVMRLTLLGLIIAGAYKFFFRDFFGKTRAPGTRLHD